MVADLGLQVRGHLRTTTEQLALGPPAEVAPCETYRWPLVLGHPQQRGKLLAVRAGGRPVGNILSLEQGHLGVFGCALLSGGLAYLVDDLGEGTDELEPLGTAVPLAAQLLLARLVHVERPTALTGVRRALIARIGGFELAIGRE